MEESEGLCLIQILSQGIFANVFLQFCCMNKEIAKLLSLKRLVRNEKGKTTWSISLDQKKLFQTYFTSSRIKKYLRFRGISPLYNIFLM